MNKNKNRNKLLGKKFGKLIVEKFVGSDKRNNSICQCLCDCGNRKNVLTYRLKIGHTISCGCEKTKLQPYEWIYNVLKRSAKSTGRMINMSFQEFLTFTEICNCHYCGEVIEWSKFSNKSNQSYYLDRKNNNEDYKKDNCVVCCKRCNWIKGTEFTYTEMLKLGKTVKEIIKLRMKK